LSDHTETIVRTAWEAPTGKLMKIDLQSEL
jgi:hypothetical protein